MYLCQDTKTKEYYHLSNYEDDSDSCLVFYLGTLDNTKVIYKKINEYIISGDSTLNATIKDAKNREFKLLAPKDEKRLGTFVIIQEDGSDKWGIIFSRLTAQITNPLIFSINADCQWVNCFQNETHKPFLGKDNLFFRRVNQIRTKSTFSGKTSTFFVQVVN